MPTTQELVNYLKKQHSSEFSFLQTLKIVYRPYICPFEDILNDLDSSRKVFDIGCGSGTFLELVAKFKSPRALGGIEINEGLVNTTKQLLSEYSQQILVNIQQYDGVKLPAAIKDYNSIFMIDVLHHIPSKAQLPFLKSLYENMSEGSELIIKDINAERPFWCAFNKLHDLIVSREIGNEMGAGKLRSQLKAIGFQTSEITERRMIVYPHFTIRCIK